ncbi:MAG: phosphoribosyltransferase, partial [Nitrospirota bacterium]|nr:phosphoribosyltransferase [Nitrospirota bacterium]
MLHDRTEAGRRLAERLGAYHRDPQSLILALPRGGVVVGAAISAALRIPLDVFLVRKLEAPEFFFAVGHHYERFAQVDDEEVLAWLKQAA